MNNAAIVARLGLDTGEFKKELQTAAAHSANAQAKMASDAEKAAQRILASHKQQTQQIIANLKKQQAAAEAHQQRVKGEAVSGVKAGGAIAIGGAIAATKEVLEYAGALQDSSDALGVNVESLQQLNFAFGQSGANAETVSKGIAKLGENLTAARDGDEKAIASFAKLGVSLDDIKKMTPDQVLMQIAASANDATDPAARLSAIVDVLGKSGLKMGAGLNGGVEALQKLRAEADIISKDDVASLDDAGDLFGKLKSKLLVKAAGAVLGAKNLATGNGHGLASVSGFAAVLSDDADAIKDPSATSGAATAAEIAAARAAVDKRKAARRTSEGINAELGVTPEKAKTDKEADADLKRGQELIAINAELEARGAEGREQERKDKEAAAEIDRKSIAEQEAAQAKLAAGGDRQLQLANEEAAIRTQIAEIAAKVGTSETAKDAAEVNAELRKQQTALAENSAEQIELAKARKEELETVIGESQAMALELAGHHKAADALRTKLAFEKLINDARERGNLALADEYSKQQALAAQVAAKKNAEKADASKGTLSDLAANARNADGAKARQAQKLENRAEIARKKGHPEEAAALQRRADKIKNKIGALKDSEKDPESDDAAEPNGLGRGAAGGLISGVGKKSGAKGLTPGGLGYAVAPGNSITSELRPHLADQLRPNFREIKRGVERGVGDAGSKTRDYSDKLDTIISKLGGNAANL